MIQQVDVSVPAEYISEVIPIKYAHGRRHRQRVEQPGRQRRKHGQLRRFGGHAIHQRRGAPRRHGGWGGGRSAVIKAYNQPNQPRAFGSQTTPGGAPDGRHHFSADGCSPSFNAPRREDSRIKSRFLARRKSLPTSGAIHCSFLPRRRTWNGSRPSSQNWTCCWRRCSSSRSSWTLDLTHSWNLGVSAAQNPKTFQGHPNCPEYHRRRRHE